MNKEESIEHKNIQDSEHIHSPFKWVVENGIQKEAITPSEDDKFLFQKDNRRVYVSSGGTFHPIVFEPVPNDDRLYTKVDGEWEALLLPVNDTFRPSCELREISGDINIVVNLSEASVKYDSFHRFIPQDNKVSFKVTSYSSPIMLTINRPESDKYKLSTILDTYYFNDTGSVIKFIIPCINEEQTFEVKPEDAFRVLFTLHEYNNVITAEVDYRVASYFDTDCTVPNDKIQ